MKRVFFYKMVFFHTLGHSVGRRFFFSSSKPVVEILLLWCHTIAVKFRTICIFSFHDHLFSYPVTFFIPIEQFRTAVIFFIPLLIFLYYGLLLLSIFITTSPLRHRQRGNMRPLVSKSPPTTILP